MTSLITQGQQQLKLGLWSIALATFERAIALDETDGAAWEGKAAALKKLGRWVEAVEVEERLVEVRSRGIVLDASFYSEQGTHFYELGMYEEAIESYEKAIEIKPDYHQAWYNRGCLLNELGRNEEAIESYEKAIEIKPDHHESWYNRGGSLDILGRNEEAIMSFEKAIEIKPDHHESWFGRGGSLHVLGQTEEAVTSYEKAIKFKPDNHEAWYNRGVLLNTLGRMKEAIMSYEKAIEFKPDNHEAWIDRGSSLHELECYQEAIASYEKAITINPNSYDAWFGRGNSLSYLQRHEEAILSYDKAIEVKPDEYNPWISRSAALIKLEEYEEAIKSCDHAIEINPKNSISWNNRGRALSSLGRYEEAITSYDNAIVRDPYDHKIWHDRSSVSGIIGFHSWTPNNQNHRVLGLYIRYPELRKRHYEGMVNSLEVGIIYCSSSEEYILGHGYLQRVLGDIHRDYAKKQRDPQPAREKAISAYKSALQVLVQDRYPEERLLTFHSIIRMYMCSRKITYAKEYQKQGIALYETLRRSVSNKRMFEAKFGTFSRTEIDLLLGENNPIRALEQAEFYKNRTLTWILDDWEAQSLSPTYAEMRSILTSDTAIVYWHLSDDALTTFILTHDNPNPVVLEVDRYNAANKLTKLIQEYKKQYQIYQDLKKDKTVIDRTNHPWRQQLPQWIETLKGILDVRAIETHLQNQKSPIRNLILIPHRDLNLLPLNIFFPHQVHTSLPSIRIGIESRAQPRPIAPNPLLLIEDPTKDVTEDSDHLDKDDLAAVELEAAILRALIPTYKTLRKKEATHQTTIAALSQPHNFFHFTGHGYHDSQNPQNSAIGLSDYPLTFKDITQLDLSPYRLINLAACETGITGKDTEFGEYIGLSSAFLKAKANTVLSTLWQVNAISNTWFTIHFYQRLLEGNPAPIALTLTQTWLKTLTIPTLIQWTQALPPIGYHGTKLLNLAIEELEEIQGKLETNMPYSDPYHWAAFILTGGTTL